MDRAGIRKILRALRSGKTTVADALEALRSLPYDDMGFARLDTHRGLRRGAPEAVYCPGKSPAQVEAIVKRLAADGGPVIATRASPEVARRIRRAFAADRVEYHPDARILVVDPKRVRRGSVLVVTAGTSDLPVAEEAAVTAEALGHRVTRLHDVGVAGVHRILDKMALLRKAKVIVVVAGMEGALPSVISGLVDRPVIAVPTSVGYGASFDGLAALLGMLNSCSPGVAVVNIDNGFGAGYLAAMLDS